MLLLVLQPKFDFRQQLRLTLNIELAEEPEHLLINILAIGPNFIERRTREEPARRPVRMITYLLVVGIENGLKALIERTIAVALLSQDERFKEPGSVREMPFGRTGSRDRLQHLIFR